MNENILKALEIIGATDVTVSTVNEDNINFKLNDISMLFTRDYKGKCTVYARKMNISNDISSFKSDEYWKQIDKSCNFSDRKSPEKIAKDILNKIDYESIAQANLNFAQDIEQHNENEIQIKELMNGIVEKFKGKKFNLNTREKEITFYPTDAPICEIKIDCEIPYITMRGSSKNKEFFEGILELIKKHSK